MWTGNHTTSQWLTLSRRYARHEASCDLSSCGLGPTSLSNLSFAPSVRALPASNAPATWRSMTSTCTGSAMRMTWLSSPFMPWANANRHPWQNQMQHLWSPIHVRISIGICQWRRKLFGAGGSGRSTAEADNGIQIADQFEGSLVPCCFLACPPQTFLTLLLAFRGLEAKPFLAWI